MDSYWKKAFLKMLTGSLIDKICTKYTYHYDKVTTCLPTKTDMNEVKCGISVTKEQNIPGALKKKQLTFSFIEY